jgi:dihydroorotate dehydrogenase (NAD+) catalytic subunit
MSASGCFGYGTEYADLVDLNKLGAVVVKATTLHPREGNKPPRIAETTAGMINAIGLQNEGVHRFVKQKLPALRRFDCPVIVNIAAKDPNEYQEIARILDDAEGVSAVEINVSCPNVSGGLDCGVDPKLTAQVVDSVRKATRLPTICKLTPNVTDVRPIARAAEEAGATAVSLINTVLAMALDVETRRPKISNVMGGLSGPAIKPIAVRMVYQVAQVVKIPVIGIGGICTAEDAIEFLLAGATAVQVGTAGFVQHTAMLEIIDGLHEYLVRHEVRDVAELIGAVRV